MKYLLDKGAGSNFVDPFGKTLLHIAAESGNEYFISYLAEKATTNLDVFDKWDQPPIELAIKKNQINSVILLAVLGSDINLKRQSKDTTPFEQAVLTNEYKLILNLVAFGGKITKQAKSRIMESRIDAKLKKLIVIFN